MKIEQIMANIRGAQSVKTAAVVAPTDTFRAALSAAVASGEKVAAEQAGPSPVADIMKIASDMSKAESDVAIKESALLGAAFVDGAMARAAQYQKAAAELNVDPEFGKFAAENQEQIKQAAQLGYAQTREGLEKMAADTYKKGYDDTVETIYKTASLEFIKAALITENLLNSQTA